MRLLAAARLSASRPALDPLGPRRLFFGGLAIGVVVMSVVGLATTAQTLAGLGGSIRNIAVSAIVDLG